MVSTFEVEEHLGQVGGKVADWAAHSCKALFKGLKNSPTEFVILELEPEADDSNVEVKLSQFAGVEVCFGRFECSVHVVHLLLSLLNVHVFRVFCLTAFLYCNLFHLSTLIAWVSKHGKFAEKTA